MHWLYTPTDLWSLWRSYYAYTATYVERDYPDLKGKVFIVTGATSGVGFDVSRLLLGQGAKVWIAARNQTKIDTALAKLQDEFPGAAVDFFKVDFCDLTSIKPGVAKFLESETKVHGVIHNAGVMVPPLGSKSKQGYELQLSTNNLGPHLLQKQLDEILIKTARESPPNSVRVVWVASMGHMFSSLGGVNWDDINYERTRAFRYRIYGQSKAINIYQAAQWASHHKDSGVVSLSVHPGCLRTPLYRHEYNGTIKDKIVDWLLYPSISGAYAELYAALHPRLTTKDNGLYILAFGMPGKPRHDINSQLFGSNGARVWDFLEGETAKFT